MLPLLLFLLAAAPTGAKAQQLAKAAQWEELYLAFAAAAPEASPKTERPRIAAALARGCAALQGDDPVMAYSLGEKSVAFHPSAEGLYCTGLTARRAEQRGAAEDAFRAGLGRFPRDGRFALELGRLYAEDGQAAEAAAAWRQVPPRTKEAAEAQRLLLELPRATAGHGDEGDDPLPLEPDSPRGAGPGGPGFGSSRSYESSVDEEGRRLRQNQYFRFRYFNAQRDFGQRADYEGKVQGALESARVASQRLLGVAREAPVDVILYSRAEFALHHGPQAAQAVAGFYSANAIRMNDSADITPQNQATLVHEYVHAVVDELSGSQPRAVPVWLNEGLAEFIEWRSLGAEGPPKHLATALTQLALQGQLPSLAQLSQGPLIATRNPALAYALSAVAVRLLVEARGMPEVLGLIRDSGRGDFAKALERRFGKAVTGLDEEVAQALKRR